MNEWLRHKMHPPAMPGHPLSLHRIHKPESKAERLKTRHSARLNDQRSVHLMDRDHEPMQGQEGWEIKNIRLKVCSKNARRWSYLLALTRFNQARYPSRNPSRKMNALTLWARLRDECIDLELIKESIEMMLKDQTFCVLLQLSLKQGFMDLKTSKYDPKYGP